MTETTNDSVKIPVRSGEEPVFEFGFPQNLLNKRRAYEEAAHLALERYCTVLILEGGSELEALEAYFERFQFWHQSEHEDR